MLSFDITDKTIKIVKGSENGDRITINNAVTIDLQDDTKESGRITEVSELANKIGEALRANNMKEKNAIVSISSNQTIFKELTIPKAKGKQFLKMVKSEMQAQLEIDDTYSISYVIVDEFKEGEGKSKTTFLKILATACPYDVIDKCKMLFSKLSISLKSVMIGCNCISKIILSDMKLCMKMPLLAVQLDRNFLSINLYDDLKLAFSRFTDVDPGDYGYSSDYMVQAVNENIFRMLQFQKTRGTDQPVENVVFYGDLDNVDDILEAIEQMELNASLLNVPPQVRGCENIDFSVYANAIGALFKRNKEVEKINLLDTDTSHKSRGSDGAGGGAGGSGAAVMLAILGVTVAAVGGVWFYLNMQYNSVADDLSSVQYKIDMAQDKKELFDKLTMQEEKINNYRNDIKNAADAFKTHPAISEEYFYLIESEMINAANELGLWAQITNISYSGYNVSLSIETAATSDPSQNLPALIVKKLLAHKEFYDVKYTGYSIGSGTYGATVSYNIQIPFSPIEPTTEPETTEASSDSAAEPDAQN